MAGTANGREHELELKHRLLDREIRRLDRRGYLTPEEQRVVAELKKEKLRTKDLLVAIRSRS